MFVFFLSFPWYSFWFLFIKAKNMRESTEESHNSAFTAFKPWVRNLAECNNVLWGAAEVAGVVWWPLSWPWLPVILVFLQWWASHSRLRLHRMKLAYIEIKDTNLVAALPVKMSPHISTSYPVENPLLIWLCDKHLRPPWDLPVSPCQLMAKHSFLCFTGSTRSKSMCCTKWFTLSDEILNEANHQE